MPYAHPVRRWLQFVGAAVGFVISIALLRTVSLPSVVGVILIVGLTVAGFVIPSAVRQ